MIMNAAIMAVKGIRNPVEVITFVNTHLVRHMSLFSLKEQSIYAILSTKSVMIYPNSPKRSIDWKLPRPGSRAPAMSQCPIIYRYHAGRNSRSSAKREGHASRDLFQRYGDRHITQSHCLKQMCRRGISLILVKQRMRRLVHGNPTPCTRLSGRSGAQTARSRSNIGAWATPRWGARLDMYDWMRLIRKVESKFAIIPLLQPPVSAQRHT